MDVAHEARTSLVGRDRELSVLRDAFDRARHERVSQLVTLVGVPGMGKSRLVYELSLVADADPELITWRQGRCLAYGDGVTLWALGEIVKAQAGVLEQDTPSDVEAKIHRAVEAALAGSGDEAWVESHLLALVGLAGETGLGGDRRNEAFAAWRRFLEAIAEERSLVLVFEDLHWADESLLDFVDELVDWVTDVPLLVIATARPELLERRPGWGGGKLNATTLALRPLSDEQTTLLIGQLLAKPLIAAESQQALLERAGGNPLYAEQFADLFLERGSTDELPLPETLQGIIAARLDGLPDGEKGSSRMRQSSGRCSGRVRSSENRATSWEPSTPSSARASSAVRSARRWRARASSRSPTRSSATSRTGRSHGPIAPTSIGGRPSGSRAWDAPKTTPSCSHTIGALRSISSEPAAVTKARSRPAHGSLSGTPATGRTR